MEALFFNGGLIVSQNWWKAINTPVTTSVGGIIKNNSRNKDTLTLTLDCDYLSPCA